MPIVALDHYNICTADLAVARRFYTEVVGLHDGERPPFGRPGAWMYVGTQAILHISTARIPGTAKSDAFDHVAFRAEGLAQTRARLDDHGIRYQSFAVPDRELVQVFFRDPDGAEIELIFSGTEAAAAIAEGVTSDATLNRTA
ncbi:MAG: VOC family protein [Proteobacteria bacterium]|nr:VOC family protein [Burkholderiales bacterium]